MILNAAKEKIPRLKADVCICGAGPAGITLALQLARNNVKVILIEGGDLRFSQQSQELYEGTSTGLPHHAPTFDRLRFFGGASNHWGGHCGTLDSQDFKEWEFHSLSGWPINKEVLDPYVAVTKKIVDWDTTLENAASKDGLPHTSRYFKSWSVWQTPGTRFGEKYLEEIKSSLNITCVLNLNLLDIILNDEKRVVTHIVTATHDNVQQKIEVRAKYFALCLGGLENPRALLNANHQIDAGIGNGNDLVGRFYMSHLNKAIGKLLLNKDVPSHFVSPSTEFREKFKTLNFGLRVYTRDGRLPGNRYKIGGHTKWSLGKSQSRLCSVPFANQLIEMIRGRPLTCEDGTLWMATEQSLNPNSRITLSDKVDRNGQRQLNVNWKLQDLCWHTVQSAVIRYGEYLIKHNLGRARMMDWVKNKQGLKSGHHHMGTTRMSSSPQTGVVDMNCKVFDLENLYIGGSSVFATSGHINPTFTILQLALRLGDHLSKELKKV